MNTEIIVRKSRVPIEEVVVADSIRSTEIPCGFFVGTIGTYKSKLFQKVPIEFEFEKHSDISVKKSIIVLISNDRNIIEKKFQTVWDAEGIANMGFLITNYRAVKSMEIDVRTY